MLKDIFEYFRIKNLKNGYKINKIKYEILKEYKNTSNEEIREIVEYLKKNHITEFCYDYTKEYIKQEPVFDDECQMYYVLHNGKRLYFKKGLSKEQVKNYYWSVCIEQDYRSPHLYMTEELEARSYRTVVDVGVAEGNFSLDIVDKCRQLYLFECDKAWNEALEKTFEPYKDKVKIINMLVSDQAGEKTTCLDKEFGSVKDIDLIKMDVEGCEENVLAGAKKILAVNNPVLLVCVYHTCDAERKIKAILSDYKIKIRNGYMIYLNEFLPQKPYLRRGVLQAEK